jgi:hypothetical protein
MYAFHSLNYAETKAGTDGARHEEQAERFEVILKTLLKI